jgi:FkbM family methyltransferase
MTLTLRSGVRFEVRTERRDWHAVAEVWSTCPYLRVGHTIDESIRVVIDIGAHIGAFSLLATSLSREALVYAYEPNVDNFRLLQRNIELNEGGHANRIRPRRAAVWSHPGRGKLFLSPASSEGHSFYPLGSGPAEEVDCVTLSAILDSEGVDTCDFLKIDCEGAEYEILASTPSAHLHRIKRMSIECHDVPGRSGTDLASLLGREGFDVQVIEYPLFSKRFAIYHSAVVLALYREPNGQRLIGPS